jgi:hypothetical protein
MARLTIVLMAPVDLRAGSVSAAGCRPQPLEFELLGVAPGSDHYLTLVQQVAGVTLAISVMGAALRLPQAYIRCHSRELALILGLGLPLMCLSTSLLLT